MNPEVEEIEFKPLAKNNVNRLSIIEHEIFETKLADGGNLISVQPKYWDIEPDDKTKAFLRLG